MSDESGTNGGPPAGDFSDPLPPASHRSPTYRHRTPPLNANGRICQQCRPDQAASQHDNRME